jgi:hypothetical protein
MVADAGALLTRPDNPLPARPRVLSHFDETPKRENGGERMEGICGKQAGNIDAATLAAQIGGYRDILIDIGTGDGRYVRTAARECPCQMPRHSPDPRPLRHRGRHIERDAEKWRGLRVPLGRHAC